MTNRLEAVEKLLSSRSVGSDDEAAFIVGERTLRALVKIARRVDDLAGAEAGADFGECFTRLVEAREELEKLQ